MLGYVGENIMNTDFTENILWKLSRVIMDGLAWLADSAHHFLVAFSLAFLVLLLTLIIFYVRFWDKESGRLVVDSLVVAYYIIGFGICLSSFCFLASHALLDSLEIFWFAPINGEPMNLVIPEGLKK